VAAGSASLKQLVEELNPGIACSYLRHGVFLNPPEEVRTPNRDRPLALTYFGKLDDSAKGVLIFPEIWRVLKEAHIPFRWTIIGSGPDENILRERMTEAVRLGEVAFHPHVPHRELGRWIQRHDVYLLTSRREAGPLTLLEAMGYGLVPICADIPCLVQEVITSQNGFRVNPAVPNAYVAPLAQLHQNRELLEEMSKAARRAVETGYSEVEMARRYVDFVQKYAPNHPASEWPARIRVKPILAPGTFRPRALIPRPLRRLVKQISFVAHRN
jgi:glycosyltransferase involved in cell wall biosynthesis